MLSFEKTPPVPDPSIPCPSQVSVVHLNGSISSSICDERVSSLTKQQDPNFVDLPPNNPHLPHHNTPLPSFSIRDYVLASRSKDIKTNWPFSLKSLQLCLKNGVKDVLPPFQSLDTVKNQPLKTSCTVDNTSLEKQNTSKRNSNLVEPSRPDPEVVLSSPRDTRLDNKLAETCIDRSSCRSGENDFPSTSTSVSQSEISVPGDGPYRRPIETTSTFFRGSVGVKPAAPSLHKTQSYPKQSGKNCRLIVKFVGNCDRNKAEDTASTYSTVPETMASKVCPVCKTFSSSSNTTLNAHIDQCLSVESTPKWTCDPKLTRHRIKPRKVRMMVDIYHTALHCTLEDLDRRNGTNWAAVSSLHTQEPDKIESFEEGTKQGVLKAHPDDAGDVGPVYIDASGTKVRILSKFSDKPTVSNGGERKPLEEGGRSKCLSKNKKKRQAQKHVKYLKLAPQIMVHGSQQLCRGPEGSTGERKHLEKEHQLPKQNKSSDLGTLRPWVCSKRRGLKNASRKSHRPVTCKWHLPQDILVENNQSVSEDSHAEVSDFQKSANLREHLTSSPRNSDEIDQSFHKALVSERRSSARKMVGNPLSLATSMNGNVNICIPPMKRKSNWLGNDGTSEEDTSMLRRSIPNRNHASLLRRAVPVHEGALNDLGDPPMRSIKPSGCSHEIATKAARFSSFRKKLSTTSGSLPVSRQSTIKKWSTIKKYQARLMTERDEEVVAWHSEFDQEYASTHDDSENELETEETTDEVSLESNTVFETRKERGLCMSRREKKTILKNSRSESHCYDHNGEANIDSSVGGNDKFLQRNDSLESARRQIQVGEEEDIDVEPFSKTADESYATSFTKPSDTECYKLNSSSKAQCDTLRSIKDYRGLLCGIDTSDHPAHPAFVNDQMTTFGTDEVGSGIMNQSTDTAVEVGSEAGPDNFFPGVDPIPIPGPPGSFLPSPRDMVSDDFHGNSSLTTSRIHSSPDQHDVMDGDSSDSPLSAASTISNSTASRSHFKYPGSSSIGGHTVQDKFSFGLLAGTIEPSVKSRFEAAQATSIGVERPVLDGEYVKLDRISIARGSLSSKSNEPCCCQRKERLPQAVALNHQESQLLRRRKIGSIMAPASEKQIGCSSDPRPTHLDERLELLPPISFPKPASENGFLPTSKPLGDHFSFNDSPQAGNRLPVHSNCESASPSASNPVLRLMGKNLMVVNKDEDASVAVARVQPVAQNNYQPHHCSTFSSISPGNVQNKDCHSFHHVSQGSTTYSWDPHKALNQHSGMSNSFGCQSRLQLPQASSQIPEGFYQAHHADCSIRTPINPQDYKVDHNLSPHSMLKNRPILPPSRHNEKALLRWDRADSVSHPVRDIIIIDEAPESDIAVISDKAKYTEGWREGSSCMPIPEVPICNVSMGYAFPCYHSQDHRPPPGESSMVCSSSFHGTPSRVAANTGSIRWGCTSDGPSVLQRSPFTTVSSSSGHIVVPAVMYYS